MTVDNGATPVIAQYLAIKQSHQDCLVFFQMGDFYELFFQDAHIASAELDIVLTFRGKFNNQDIPMCGVPVHNYASYSERLVKKGYKIALCEQRETPNEAKKRGSKAVVNRQVVRIITAGTLTEDHLLDARQDNFLCVVSVDTSRFCSFFYDISTGKSYYSVDVLETLKSMIETQKPSEIIYTHSRVAFLLGDVQIPQTLHEIQDCDEESGSDYGGAFAVMHEFYGKVGILEQQTLILLSHYLRRTQCGVMILWKNPVHYISSDYMQIDSAGQNNLEIFKTLSGDKKPSLLSCLDQCVTAAGSRLLAYDLKFPLTDSNRLNERYDAIEFFIHNQQLAVTVQNIFKKTADINRILGRVKTHRATPADLGHIKNTLSVIYSDFRSLNLDKSYCLPPLLVRAYNGICYEFSCYDFLCRALSLELPIALKIGAFIQSGYDDILDEYKNLRDNARQYILNLEAEYKTLTGVHSLKIKHNHVIGYHIDISSIHAEKILNVSYESVHFMHKQTLANQMRFTTHALLELEKKITEATLCFEAREKEIFIDLCQAIDLETASFLIFSDAIAQFDLYATHSILAAQGGYCRPELMAHKQLVITQGRHCVIEDLLHKKGKKFIPNDASFRGAKNIPEIWILTGPNMGGKSTYLRQTALMIIMAQSGLFVPAQSYRAGIFDKIFSRVGASDNLAEGKSTFMTEMCETALILAAATSHSFVILDELGRGTSTYDGLAIAYATLKYLSETIGAMGLFATHYHELTEMITAHRRVGNMQVMVSEHNNDIIFLHKIAAGAAQKSYGIYVAQLAGMPLEVIHVAQDFLKNTDKKRPNKCKNKSFNLVDTQHILMLSQE